MIQIGHACPWFDLQRDLKFQGKLHMKSFKLWGQSEVSVNFGLKTLDHIFLFSFIFIFVSLLLWSSKLCLDHCFAFPQMLYTQLVKQAIKSNNTYKHY